MGPAIEKFLADKKLMLGICNGFQVLATLGLFNNEKVAIALDENTGGAFINRWEDITVHDNKCPWTKNLKSMKLPIRHGEGRVVFTKKSTMSDHEQYLEMKNNSRVVMTYHTDPNGSFEKVAGVCDDSGQVFGLMPHPEAARADFLYPGQHVVGSLGLTIFENMKNYLKETF
jgi:phosphoribosylformylglycinamidine (FGAM) synthase-like amidotransferase family enzyme